VILNRNTQKYFTRMAFVRRRRDERFVDSEDSFQKVPSNGFAHTFVYKYVKELVSVNFSTIRQLLQDELNRNTNYRGMWNMAKTEYSKKKNRLTSSLPEECHIALIAYTLEGPLYKDFNHKCKTLKNDNDWNNFPYKSLYALLARSIHGIDNNPSVSGSIYYRGMSFRKQKLSFKEGDYIHPVHFLSCSVDEEVAVQFMGEEQATLIAFKGSPMAACGIAGHSAFPDENEILVFPWSTFKVAQIERRQYEDVIVLESAGSLVGDLPYSGPYAQKGKAIAN
jgi:hypothetical protein